MTAFYLIVFTVIPIRVLVRIVKFIFILDNALSKSNILPLSSPEKKKTDLLKRLVRETLTYFVNGSMTARKADLLFDWFEFGQTSKSVVN